jgi:hypothetical protein
MFESQYNEEMAGEIARLEAKGRAAAAGHPEWDNACTGCGCRMEGLQAAHCVACSSEGLDRPVTWQLWRQDDNGQRFLVGEYREKTTAEARMAELMRCLHKQTYWIEPVAG